MPWFKVDDAFPEHPKLETLEVDPLRYMAAVTVWTVMGADCSRRLTDGFVSAVRLKKKLGFLKKHAQIGAETLVEIGLWTTEGDGFQYHDWLEYQPSKATTEKKRRLKANRQKRWREGREDALRDASELLDVVAPTDARVDASTDASEDRPVARAPTRPDPIPTRSPFVFPPPGRDATQPANDQSGTHDDPPNREPDEPEPSDADRLRLPHLVALRYAERHLAATASPPAQTAKQREAYEAVAQWLEAKNGDPERLVRTLLDGWFADSWAREHGYPITALANAPAKYFAPPKVLRGSRRSGFMPPAQPEDFEPPTDLDTIFGKKAAGTEGAQ